MKFFFYSILAIGITHAADTTYHQNSCKDYARVAPTQSDQANLAYANTCKKLVAENLQEKVKALDNSSTNCESALEAAKQALLEAKAFQASSQQALAWQGPDQSQKNRFKSGILDLTYALTDDIQDRACDPVEYIGVKAQAQTEILALERTKFSLP